MMHRQSIVKKASLSLLEKDEQEKFFTLIEVTNSEDLRSGFDEFYQPMNLQGTKKGLNRDQG